MKQYADLDFSKAAKILNVLVDPVASDDTGLGTGQMWFNTTSKFFKGYDGTTKFSLLRDDLSVTITGVFTFNPGSGNVPFAVHSSKTDVVTYLNADEVDGYDASESATASTLAARDASGNLTVATPTSDGHAATKAYVDSIAAGQDWKDSCVVATTANITLSGTQTIDGVSVVADDRVLVKDQTTASENGIYVCAAGAWSRASDADADAEVTSGLTVFVEEGTENAGSGYTLTTTGTIVVGTTSLTFSRSSGGSVYTAGNGMVKSGTTFHFGQSASYTVGALPYADGSDSIGFISAVASGKVLKSNGTGKVPLWAAVDLTADVTGTLPVGNGGTGTDTQFTEGSVVFAGASGVYAQDATNLVWNSGATRLDVTKVGVAAGSAGSPSLTFNDDSNTGLFRGTGGDIIGFATAGVERMRITDDGKVGIGTITPQGLLHIDTQANSSSNLYLGANRTSDDTAIGQIIGYWDGTTVAKIALKTGDDTVNKDNGEIVFETASAGTTVERMRVDSDGNVVIGATSTTRDFEVSRTGGADMQLTSLTSGEAGFFQKGFSSTTNLATGASNGGAYQQLYNLDATDGNFSGIGFFNSNSLIVAGILGVNTSHTSRHGALVFQTHNGTSLIERGRFDKDGYLTLSSIGTGSVDSVLVQSSGVVQARTIYSGAWTGDADTVDGYEASALLDLANSTGDTDDISEGATNLYYTDGRARTALSGVADRISYTSSTGVIDIAATYVGQSSITTLGTIATGTWNGTVIANGYGGTGQSTYAAGDMLYASAINTLSKLTVGATDTVMRVAGGVPTWSAIDSAVWDGSYLSAFDTDDLAEGVTNLFYTDARARGSISSTASTELAYNSSTGVWGLGTEAGRVKSGSLGAGASPTFSHNLGTRDVLCQVYRNSSPYDEVKPEIKRTDTNTVTVEFTGITPSSGDFIIVCTAANG